MGHGRRTDGRKTERNGTGQFEKRTEDSLPDRQNGQLQGQIAHGYDNQQGSDRPQTYSLSVNPAALTFGAEDDRPQEVIVTVEGNDLTWSTDIAESGRSWLTVTESDGKFSVTASPNPEPARRTADITVTPSDAAVPAKAVRVTQEAKELLPSLNVTLTNGATPPKASPSITSARKATA